ncbi:hypothetical protein WME97_40115 [Sorangium sp. So ce367]|uniref:hypothetical protein n=1 Tax=Sorangium sp. So ce367 TaxID=3133305 RepID=UPI003F646CA7
MRGEAVDRDALRLAVRCALLLGFGPPVSRASAELDATGDDYIPWESDGIEGVGTSYHCMLVPITD